MWKVSVKNILNGGQWGAEYDTEALADAWISDQVASNGWGLPGRKLIKNGQTIDGEEIFSSYPQELVVGIVNEFYREKTVYEYDVDGNPVLDLDGNQVKTVTNLFADFVILKAEYEIIKENLLLNPAWVEEQELIQARMARVFGSDLYEKIEDRVLLFNKKLAIAGSPLTSEQILALFDVSDSLKRALGGAAFGTAKQILNGLKLAYPAYSAIADFAINEIDSSGYEE